MDKFWNQSVTRRLLKLLILGFLINASIYGIIIHFGGLLLKDFFVGSSFIYDSQQKNIDALQVFVTDNGIAADNYGVLRDWAYHAGINRLTVVRDCVLICDTGYEGLIFDDQSKTEFLNKNWMYFHKVDFSDGSADVFIYDNYTDHIYYLFYTGALGFCFLLFIIIFSMGLRKELRYIKVLNQSVKRIESGEWEQAVPVRGADRGALLHHFGIFHLRMSE